MLRSSFSVVVACLLLIGLLVGSAPAASSRAEQRSKFSEKVKLNVAKLGTGNHALVAIKLRDKTRLAGYIEKVSEDSFVVVHPKFGTIASVNYADVAQVKGHNLSTGAKIAIGIGIGAAIVLVALLIYLNCCTG
jgi:hypothetical protein